MKVRVYDVKDHDVLERYFGEQAGDYPITALERLGEVIFDDSMSILPMDGEVVVFESEYVVMARYFYPGGNRAVLIVHERHFNKEIAS